MFPYRASPLSTPTVLPLFELRLNVHLAHIVQPPPGVETRWAGDPYVGKYLI